MLLVLEIVAFAMLGSAVVKAVESDGLVPARSSAVGVVLIGVAVAVASAFTQVGDVGAGIWSSRATESLPDQPGRDLQSGVAFGAREDFLSWAEQRIGSHEKVFLFCGFANCQEGHNLWLAYRFAPRRWTDSPKEADWLVFYSTTAAAAGISLERLNNVVSFAPGFQIAKLRPAGG